MSRIKEQRIPGLGIGIVDHDRVVRVAGYGTADQWGRPVTPRTPFILGSLSKSFTALAIMQIVESGQIELDARVRRYIPWFTLAEDSSQDITVRQLLNHAKSLTQKHRTYDEPSLPATSPKMHLDEAYWPPPILPNPNPMM